MFKRQLTMGAVELDATTSPIHIFRKGELCEAPESKLKQARFSWNATLRTLIHNIASTSSACPSGFTCGQIFLMRPSGPMRKVTRCVPRYFRPIKLFFPQTP